jgi:predicted Zn-dependent protease
MISLQKLELIYQTIMDDFHERILIAAQGYSELGLPDLALAELESLPAECQSLAPAVETRLCVLMQARRWKDALPVGRELCRLVPDKSCGYIHSAFCMHELGDTSAAREILLNGPSTLKSEATYHYNLACYAAKLGRLDEARAHLDVSFAMLKDYALEDPDLDVLRAFQVSLNA